MTGQTGAAAPGAPAASTTTAQQGAPDPAAVAEAWKEARANRPGVRFTKLPPNVAALYANTAAPAESTPAAPVEEHADRGPIAAGKRLTRSMPPQPAQAMGAADPVVGVIDQAYQVLGGLRRGFRRSVI